MLLRALLALLALATAAHAQGTLGPQGDITSVGATANGGLTGGATKGPALLGLLTTCTDGQILKWTAGTTSWGCAADSSVSDGDKGDITVSASGATYTIDADAVVSSKILNGTISLADMADIATARFIGRTTGGTGVPEALTGTQATAMLDNFTSGLKGLAPLSGGGTTNYLRADGTWAAPPGGGGESTVAGAGLTLTGTTVDLVGSSDFVVNANDLDLSTAVTAPGTLVVSGNATFGDAFTDTATVIGELALSGTNFYSYINYSTDEDTYIRAGKTASDVYVGDVNTGGIHLGSASNATEVLGTLAVTGTSGLTGLVTATAGVTTPATTGSGDVVSGDDLTVADDATVTDALSVLGSSTIGDTSASDTHQVNGQLIVDGAAASTGIYFKDGTINCNFEDNSTSTCIYGQYGYNGGTTQYRSHAFYNANGTLFVRFNGPSQLSEFFGATTLYGATTLGDAPTDIVLLTGQINVDNDSGKLSTKSAGAMTYTNCGSGYAAVGDRTAGHITIGTTPGSCEIDWTTAYAANPSCHLTTRGATKTFSYTADTSKIVITSPTAGQIYDWFCVDHF